MSKRTNILLFLSDYKALKSDENPKGACEEYYYLEGADKKISGIQTNDAPIKYLFEKMKDKDASLSRVICITSYKVLTEPAGNPQIERFRQFVNKYKEEHYIGGNTEYINIPYDYDELTKLEVDFGNKLPVMIYNRLSSCFKNVEKDEEVYIDYTGGFRDISFLMTAIIRFLEYKGLKCGEIVYSKYFGEKRIYDIHYIYDLYQLINGVNEFTNTGNAKELAKTYDGKKSEASRLIKSLIDFSNALSICDIANLDNYVKAINEALQELDDSNTSDINSMMLKTLVPIIREKLYLDKEYKNNYPQMIRWCAENNMIQQAATIYTDKMPIYYFENHMVPEFVDLNGIVVKPGHELYETAFYTELFDKIAVGIEVPVFKSVLKEIAFTDSANRTDVVAALEKKRNEIQDGILIKALNRLISCINACYENDIQDQGSQNSITFNIKLKKEGDYNFILYPKNEYNPDASNTDEDGFVYSPVNMPPFKNFWEQLIGKDNYYWCHRFLYNNKEDYIRIASKKHDGKELMTYRKKAFAIERVKVGKYLTDAREEIYSVIDVEDNIRISKIMAYYLAIKIMRNRMNHAGETVRSIDEEQAIASLNGVGFGINFSDDIESYRQILLNGISDEIGG